MCKSNQNGNGNQTLEKIMIPADSAVFILYDPQHKPLIQVFKNVIAYQNTRKHATAGVT